MSEVFKTTISHSTFGAETFGIIYPPNFAVTANEDVDRSFDELCSSMRFVDEAIKESQELSEAIAVLLNRAYEMGLSGNSKSV
jgi:hypothetical protein